MLPYASLLVRLFLNSHKLTLDFFKTHCIIVYMKSKIKECFKDAECAFTTISGLIMLIFLICIGVSNVA